MDKSSVNSLADLDRLRSAPELDEEQKQTLLAELLSEITRPQWFTLGVMAPSESKAIEAIRQVERFFKWPPMQLIERPESMGPVFLKANQSSSEIRIRLEEGLGEGILISGHHSDPMEPTFNCGPLPLNFFCA